MGLLVVAMPPQRLVMGCIGLLGTVPSSHGPTHPIASLCGGIATPRRPITKIGTPHCTITNSNQLCRYHQLEHPLVIVVKSAMRTLR